MIKAFLGLRFSPPRLLAQAPQQAAAGANPIRGRDCESGYPIHPQLWRTATGVACWKAPVRDAPGSTTTTTVCPIFMWSAASRLRTECIRIPLKQAPAIPPHNHLYRNNGDGTFTDVTDQAGVAANIFGTAAIAADFDNDGFVDLLVTGYGQGDSLPQQRRRDVRRCHCESRHQSRRLVDQLRLARLRPRWLCRSVCRPLREVRSEVSQLTILPTTIPGRSTTRRHQPPLPQQLQRNVHRCDATSPASAPTKGAPWASPPPTIDGDGYPDIYVANDKTENFLFHNKHDGTFEEIAGDLGVAYGQNGEMYLRDGPGVRRHRWRRPPRSLGDRFEVQPADAQHRCERIRRHRSELRESPQATAQYVSWGSGVYDFDNDGWLDILVFHGGLIHLVPQEQSLFRGLGNGKFADVSRDAGPVLDVKTVSRGACFADYDNDGKVDAFVVNLGAPATLLHNVSPEQQSLAHGEAEGEEKQSRWHWSAPGTAVCGAQTDRRARCRIRLSLAGRRPRSLRARRLRTSREAHDPLAEWRGADPRERCRRSRAHRGGTVDASAPHLMRELPANGAGCCRLRLALLAMAAMPAAKQSAATLKERYLSPLEMAVSPDGHLLYVVCQDSDEATRRRCCNRQGCRKHCSRSHAARDRDLRRRQTLCSSRMPGPTTSR